MEERECEHAAGRGKRRGPRVGGVEATLRLEGHEASDIPGASKRVFLIAQH